MADNVIGAFSEEHTAQLAGVTRVQLREWDRRGLLSPSYSDEPHVPYGRIYSFRDLVSARVLGQLRAKHRVSYRHLEDVHRKLSALSDAPWASTVIYVLGREVVVVEPGTKRRHKPASGQGVFNIDMKVVIGSIREDLAKLNERGDDKIGKVRRDKFIAQNQFVIAGTRIPVAAIQSFGRAGYGVDQIRKEYPELAREDVESALAFKGDVVAA